MYTSLCGMISNSLDKLGVGNSLVQEIFSIR